MVLISVSQTIYGKEQLTKIHIIMDKYLYKTQ